MRRFALLLVRCLAVLALTGCGGGVGEAGNGTSEATTVTSEHSGAGDEETSPTKTQQRLGAISFANEASDGEASIFTIDPNGGDLRLLVSATTSTHTWSADGQLLAYESNAGISILDVATQSTEPVRMNDLSPWSTVLSPDGEQLAFTRSSRGVWTAQVATGELKRLTFGDDEHPQWSPDGRSIAFVRGLDEI